jgi:hypothetical protein
MFENKKAMVLDLEFVLKKVKNKKMLGSAHDGFLSWSPGLGVAGDGARHGAVGDEGAATAKASG